MKVAILGFIAFNLVACGSAQKSIEGQISPDVVLSRIDGLTERPSWLKESEPFRVESGRVVSTGIATIPADHRVEAALRISQNNAKAAIAGAIESRLSFVFQNAEEGTALDSTQARHIGAEASELVSNSIRPYRQYWEKVAMTTDSGERVTRYKVFSSVSMPEEDFKRAIIDAARKRQGKSGLSTDFAKKVNDHWEKFVNTDVQASPQRDAASAE